MLTVFQCLGHSESSNVEDGDLVVPQIDMGEIFLVKKGVVADVTDSVILENYPPQAWEE